MQGTDSNPATSHFQAFKRFLKLESSGGILLIVAAVFAMLLKNSPIAEWYDGILNLPIQIRIDDLNLDKPLVLWVNDGLMAVFFMLVSLEIKREILVGHLSKLSILILPGVAAIGGMLVPALIYVGFTMSLFIGSLAFQEVGIGYNRADRIGIICGSVIAGLAGYLILRRTLPRAAV